MARLYVDGRPVAPVEICRSRRARRRGLLGRHTLAGAMLLAPCRSVHTFGMRFAIDVAACDRDMRVRRIVTLAPGRVLWPRRHQRAIVEAPAGALVLWGVRVGDAVEVRS